MDKARRKEITLKQALRRGYNDRWKGASVFGNPYAANDYQASWRKGWCLADAEIEENQEFFSEAWWRPTTAVPTPRPPPGSPKPLNKLLIIHADLLTERRLVPIRQAAVLEFVSRVNEP